MENLVLSFSMALIESAKSTCLSVIRWNMHNVRRCVVENIRLGSRRSNSSDMPSRWKLIADALGMKEIDCNNRILKSAILRNVDLTKLRHTMSVLHSVKISANDLLECPEILTCPPFDIEQHHRSLVELGLAPVGIPEIVRFRYLLTQTPDNLRRIELMAVDINPVEHLARATCHDTESAALLSKKNYGVSGSTLRYIRVVLLRELLSRMLACSVSRAEQLLSVRRELTMRSLGYVRDTIDGLTKELKFPPDVIIANDFLLLAKQTNLELIRRTMPETPPMKLCDFLSKKRTILTANVERVTNVNAHLSEINAKQIGKKRHVFVLWPRSVTSHTRFLTLPVTAPKGLIAVDFTSKLLAFIYGHCKSRQVPGGRRVIFSYSACLKTPHRSQMRGTDFTMRQAVVNVVAQRLGCSQEEVERLLYLRDGSAIATWRTATPFLVTRMLNLLLRDRGFSSAQVMHALPLLLHDYDAVVQHLDALPGSEHLSLFGEWLSHPYVLQLVLYQLMSYLLPNSNKKVTQRSSRVSTIEEVTEANGD